MSVGLPSRGWGGPRVGTFAPRRRSALAKAFAKGGVARSWDWPLIFVTCGLTVLGTVLVWSATEPLLHQAGLDPNTYLKKAALWAVLGLIFSIAYWPPQTAAIDGLPDLIVAFTTQGLPASTLVRPLKTSD